MFKGIKAFVEKNAEGDSLLRLMLWFGLGTAFVLVPMLVYLLGSLMFDTMGLFIVFFWVCVFIGYKLRKKNDKPR